jgi:hypothetical protein
MDKNSPELFDEAVMNEARLASSDEVRLLARGYFGEYVNVELNEDFRKMARQTAELISSGVKIITGAAFLFKNTSCIVDVLINNGGSLDIFEVKSSNNETEINKDEIAYQYYVVSKCGYKIRRSYLIHLNGDYVRDGELDFRQLFLVSDYTNLIRPKLRGVENNLRKFGIIADKSGEPKIEFGSYCRKPRPCGYRKFCWRAVPPKSIFDLAKISLSKAVPLYQSGIITYSQILDSGIELTPEQELQILTEVYRLPPQINAEVISAWLEKLSYPLYFLDFESYQRAVPPFDGMRPWMQIPTQYSLHWLGKKGGELRHREFLAREGENPLRPLAESLCANIPAEVCVLAYSKNYEEMVIRNLAQEFPDLSERLLSWRFLDLSYPFEKKAYYANNMDGSWSIKKVLPALFPNAPELDYNALGGVHSGGEAMAAYAKLTSLPEEERAELRKQLLNYCRLDTLAMVKILEKLYAAVA